LKHTKDKNVIHLNGKWAFSGDKRCVTLFEKKVSKDGKLAYYPKGYYNNIQDMFERLVDHDTNACHSLASIVSLIKELKINIAACCDALADHYETMHRFVDKRSKNENQKKPDKDKTA